MKGIKHCFSNCIHGKYLMKKKGKKHSGRNVLPDKTITKHGNTIEKYKFGQKIGLQGAKDSVVNSKKWLASGGPP